MEWGLCVTRMTGNTKTRFTRMLNVIFRDVTKNTHSKKFSWLPHPHPLIGLTVGPSLDPCSSLPWRTSHATRRVSTAFFRESDWVLILHKLFLLPSCALRCFLSRGFSEELVQVCFVFLNGGLCRAFVFISAGIGGEFLSYLFTAVLLYQLC